MPGAALRGPDQAVMEREVLLQVARMLGDDRVLAPLGLSRERLPPSLDDGQRQQLQSLLEGELTRLAEALLAEAAACDDVVDRHSGLVYLEDRLRHLEKLLAPHQVEHLRGRLHELTRQWA